MFIVRGDDSCDYNNDDDEDDDENIIQVMTKITHMVCDTNWRICSMVFDTVHRNIIFVCISFPKFWSLGIYVWVQVGSGLSPARLRPPNNRKGAELWPSESECI